MACVTWLLLLIVANGNENPEETNNVLQMRDILLYNQIRKKIGFFPTKWFTCKYINDYIFII